MSKQNWLKTFPDEESKLENYYKQCPRIQYREIGQILTEFAKAKGYKTKEVKEVTLFLDTANVEEKYRRIFGYVTKVSFILEICGVLSWVLSLMVFGFMLLISLSLVMIGFAIYIFLGFLLAFSEARNLRNYKRRDRVHEER